MSVARERMADKHGVAAIFVQIPVDLVGDGDRADCLVVGQR